MTNGEWSDLSQFVSGSYGALTLCYAYQIGELSTVYCPSNIPLYNDIRSY